MSIKTRLARFFLAGMLAANPCSLVLAGMAPEAFLVKITGQIMEPAPCIIGGTGENGTISVDFGDHVMVNHLDDGRYKQLINYTITCYAARENSLMLRIVGTPANFGNGLLDTDAGGLAIAITNGTVAYPVNTFLNFNYPDKPQLYAAPVARPGADLQGRPFSASAVMQVFYQ